MGEEKEKERIWSWEEKQSEFFSLFFLATGNRFHTKLKSTVTIKVTLVNGLDLGGYGMRYPRIFKKYPKSFTIMCSTELTSHNIFFIFIFLAW